MTPLLRALVFTLVAASAALFASGEVFAFGHRTGGRLIPQECQDTPCPVTAIGTVGQRIQRWLVNIGGAVAVLAVIIAGVRYIVAVFQGADAGAIAEAKKSLVYAIVGVVVLLIAYVLILTIFRALGGTNLPTFP